MIIRWLMYILVVALTVAIIYFLYSGLSVKKEANRVGKKASNLLREIDLKFESFAEKRISIFVVNQNSLEMDVDIMTEEALKIIKPEVEALISHINASTNSSVIIDYTSKYFKNLESFSETLFIKTSKNKTENLSMKDEERVYDACKDAIISDLSKRKLELRSGL